MNRRDFIYSIAAGSAALYLTGCATASGTPVEVRKLTPPKLDGAYLGQRILCYRPLRKGSPNMSIEFLGEQLVGHNYGHGGSGWTLGPGSARRSAGGLRKRVSTSRKPACWASRTSVSGTSGCACVRSAK